MRTRSSYVRTSPSQLIKNIYMAYCATIFSNTVSGKDSLRLVRPFLWSILDY